MELYGVKFNDPKGFEAIKLAIDSSVIEGFEPTKESVNRIKSVFEGQMTITELVNFHKNEDRNISL